MTEPAFNIKYLTNNEINKGKWDECIDGAGNGLIYGYSYYLDRMAKHWDALVLDDYLAAMPLTWNKKFGFYYLYQPPFTANLGVFGNNLSTQLTTEFTRLIPKKFRLIEISMNAANILAPGPAVISRNNYTLSLSGSYDQLYKNYRENHRRNIQKALQQECFIKKNMPLEEIIEFNKRQTGRTGPVNSTDYNRFRGLCELLSAENKVVSYGVLDSSGATLASAIFFFSHNRAYYIMAGNNPAGKNAGASHALIDAFIKDHAGSNLVLDFEGSDIEGVALFYSGFGAVKEVYPAIRCNRLPVYLRWLKNNY